MHQTQFSEKNPIRRVFPNPVTLEFRRLRAEQDRAYEESLQADIAKVSGGQCYMEALLC